MTSCTLKYILYKDTYSKNLNMQHKRISNYKKLSNYELYRQTFIPPRLYIISDSWAQLSMCHSNYFYNY